MQRYLKENENEKGIFLETAHPVKFPEAVEKSIERKIEIPAELQSMMEAEKKSIKIKADYISLKEILLNR